MFGDGSLTFREFIMREPLPLATIHDAGLEFLRGRTDAVLFGAHAVNAYEVLAKRFQSFRRVSSHRRSSFFLFQRRRRSPVDEPRFLSAVVGFHILSVCYGTAMMSAHRGSQTELTKGQFTPSLLM